MNTSNQLLVRRSQPSRARSPLLVLATNPSLNNDDDDDGDDDDDEDNGGQADDGMHAVALYRACMQVKWRCPVCSARVIMRDRFYLSLRACARPRQQTKMLTTSYLLRRSTRHHRKPRKRKRLTQAVRRVLFGRARLTLWCALKLLRRHRRRSPPYNRMHLSPCSLVRQVCTRRARRAARRQPGACCRAALVLSASLQDQEGVGRVGVALRGGRQRAPQRAQAESLMNRFLQCKF